MCHAPPIEVNGGQVENELNSQQLGSWANDFETLSSCLLLSFRLQMHDSMVQSASTCLPVWIRIHKA